MNASEIGVVSKVYCSVFFMYLMYPMLPVSLDCPFFIVLSIFSNVYFIPQLRKHFIFHIFRNSLLVLSEKRTIKTVYMWKCNVAITTKEENISSKAQICFVHNKIKTLKYRKDNKKWTIQRNW
jgi:hypothetical protein